MTDPHDESSTEPSAPGSAVGSCIWLSVILVAVWPLFAWFGYDRNGMSGVGAALIALLVCWAGAMVALIMIAITRGTPAAIHAALLGTFSRMGIPLVIGFLLNQAGGELARAGVFGMILCYYFVALFAETLLSVRLLGGFKQDVVKA